MRVRFGSAAYFLARRLKVPLHLIVHDDCFRDIPQNAWLRRHLESRFGTDLPLSREPLLRQPLHGRVIPSALWASR